MGVTSQLTGRLVVAGRALTGVSQSELAATADIPVETLRHLEASGAAWIPDPQAGSRDLWCGYHP
jgi:hypothetical protein